MIRSFLDKKTEALSKNEWVARFQHVERVARRKLLQVEAAKSLGDLKVPPGNRLEALSGSRKGQHSIRVNDQWRVCFVWKNADAYDVELTDYH